MGIARILSSNHPPFSPHLPHEQRPETIPVVDLAGEMLADHGFDQAALREVIEEHLFEFTSQPLFDRHGEAFFGTLEKGCRHIPGQEFLEQIFSFSA